MRPEHKKKKDKISQFEKSRSKANRKTNGLRKEKDDSTDAIERFYKGISSSDAIGFVPDAD
jgi:hypothetical protein